MGWCHCYHKLVHYICFCGHFIQFKRELCNLLTSGDTGVTPGLWAQPPQAVSSLSCLQLMNSRLCWYVLCRWGGVHFRRGVCSVNHIRSHKWNLDEYMLYFMCKWPSKFNKCIWWMKCRKWGAGEIREWRQKTKCLQATVICCLFLSAASSLA